jgi:hypothetical protein
MSYEAWGEPPDCYCEMCGCECGSCICESCPECGEAGNPKCYKIHGMVETEEQIQSRIQHSLDNDFSPDEWY